MPLLTRRSVKVLSKSLLAAKNVHQRPALASVRFFSEQPEYNSIHFRHTSTPHPLASKNDNLKAKVPKVADPNLETFSRELGDHTGLQQNHIWTEEELKEKLSTLYHHKPQTIVDHCVHSVMYGLYHTFNFISGYKHVNPTVQAIEWRLIVLESVAGVPGFVAAGFRHFHSLRTLQRDHGWIATLLEEAENERMHLLLCLNKFDASFATRTMVIVAQMVMIPLLMATYTVSPKVVHRFVGYLEETACKTYVNIIDHVETPGTNLNLAWHDMDASPMAKGYYKLPDNAKWVDTLKCMMADEAHHRDVNHTFADLKADDPNPFINMHREDNERAWTLMKSGTTAWAETISPATGAAGIKNTPVYKTNFKHDHAHQAQAQVHTSASQPAPPSA